MKWYMGALFGSILGTIFAVSFQNILFAALFAVTMSGLLGAGITHRALSGKWATDGFHYFAVRDAHTLAKNLGEVKALLYTMGAAQQWEQYALDAEKTVWRAYTLRETSCYSPDPVKRTEAEAEFDELLVMSQRMLNDARQLAELANPTTAISTNVPLAGLQNDLRTLVASYEELPRLNAS